MDVQIIARPPLRILMLRHRGAYETLSPVFDRLWTVVQARNVPVQGTIGVYWDNPEHVPAARLRSAAAVEVPDGFALGDLGDAGGLPLELGRLAGGEYAFARHVGPYEELAAAWAAATRRIEGSLRRRISDEPAYEVYANDPEEVAPRELVAELYMPLSPPPA